MNIAASSELVSRLSTHRGVVALDSTDFTDVAAVVMTVTDSRSGILALLKRTGFHLPVFILTEENIALPAGATAVIRGTAQEWLELESAASLYFAAGGCSYPALYRSRIPLNANGTVSPTSKASW